MWCGFIIYLRLSRSDPVVTDVAGKKKLYLMKAKVLFDCIGREEHFSIASYDKQKTV